MNFIAMDFETASAVRSSAVSMAVVVVRDNQLVDEFYSLINPQTTFNPRNIQIHGIQPADVVDAPLFPDVWQQIKQFYTPDQLVIAHNAPFDNGVLRATLDHYGVAAPHYLSLDTVRTSRRFYPELPNHRLNTVSSALGIDLLHHHNALDDTVAAAQILVTQAEQFGVDQIKPLVKVI
ncbi:3'-5' exonuclease [Weissella diestrammenae]|uniref:DNA polymerase III polC-type n=1 Tax=Weissella diestrammenae TaxID=1162633 RepID=A0A7G9T412_9LACO|nr:3'-5' exonuclease [Weissella diestrammenae]MCM0583035.1 3'-5' exonuclease [Weissella diestrammenae]QNN74837.1 3'-5' exonuclease [Weissella diestrammenae]